ncbi:hypothetical protein E4U12_005565 [Claviceps purpurea]|nr:hypothetical protein E4U12_005565 [Claviceps purpurea]
MEFLDEANANTKMRLSRTGQASSYKCDYRQIVVAALLNVLFNSVELIAASRRFDSNPFFSAVLPDGRLMPVSPLACIKD